MARGAAERLRSEPPPECREGLAERVAALHQILIAARAGRAHLAATLARVEAANRFRETPGERQNLVEPISF